MVEVGRKALLVSMASAVSGIAGLATLVLLARATQPESIGMYAFALASFQLIAMVGSLGLDAAMTREIALGERPAGDVLATFWRQRIRLVVGFGAACLLGVFTIHWTIGFTDATNLPVVLTVLGFILVQQFSGGMRAYFAARRMTATLETATIVEAFVRLAMVAILVFAFRQGTISAWGLRISAVYLLALMTAEVWLLIRYRTVAPRGGQHRKDLARSLWAVALPLALAGAMATVNANLDRLVIGYFWSSGHVGEYFAAQRLLSPLSVVAAALSGLAMPWLLDVAKGQAERMAAATRQLLRSMSLILMPFVVGAILLASPAAHILLSDEYAGAAVLLPIQAGIIYASGLSMILLAYIVARGRVKIAARLTAAVALVNMAANVYLVPTGVLVLPGLGLAGVGAMWGTLLAQLVLVIAGLVVIRKLDGVWLVHGDLVRHGGAAAIVYLVASRPWFSMAFGGIERAHQFIGAGALVVLLYGVLVVALGGLRGQETQAILRIFNPREMRRYIREELRRPDDQMKR